ncbi:MAG: hypothetical protein KAW52_04090, partial [candidate division Zixibacteria bacterium]|nr:hypothetical protein [candidate division Zixibacteria bacterium]
MMDALSDLGVDFVGGTRGGFIFPGFPLGADAMFDVVKILELLAKNGRSLGVLRKKWDKFFMVRRAVPCSWGKKGLVMRQLLKYTENLNRQLIDGVRVIQNDSWVLVTPDRKKATFHIYTEAKDQTKAEALLKEYSQKVEEWQSKIEMEMVI